MYQKRSETINKMYGTTDYFSFQAIKVRSLFMDHLHTHKKITTLLISSKAQVLKK